MAFLIKFSVIFCTFLLYSASYRVPVQNTELRIPEPFLAVLCADFLRNNHSKKILCVICKGFDPSCFVKKTTTTTTSSTTPTTTTTLSTTTTTTSGPTTSVASTTVSSSPTNMTTRGDNEVIPENMEDSDAGEE